MAISITRAVTFFSAAATGLLLAPNDVVLAKSGKQYEVQEYKFKKPMHGYDGQAAGGYYCSYVRIPDRKCKIVSGQEVCKTKGWILRQECR
ncbi:MAG: hypothetical protein APF80_13300 [Alphaproteobacteria bacterium BRH_c36]|nr:MAG: hypothetical protein APF80_13300 [Alphaproteobacteria bacterium BRH_c36]